VIQQSAISQQNSLSNETMKTTPLFLETIKIHQGEIYHLSYHQQRVEKTIQAHYPKAKIPQLQLYLLEKNVKNCTVLLLTMVKNIKLKLSLQ